MKIKYLQEKVLHLFFLWKSFGTIVRKSLKISVWMCVFCSVQKRVHAKSIKGQVAPFYAPEIIQSNIIRKLHIKIHISSWVWRIKNISEPELPVKKENFNFLWQNYFPASCTSGEAVEMNHLNLKNKYSG